MQGNFYPMISKKYIAILAFLFAAHILLLWGVSTELGNIFQANSMD